MVFFKADLLLGVGVVSAQPRFICTTADFPGGGAAGDANTVTAPPIPFALFSPKEWARQQLGAAHVGAG
jgi:hypothetical protein